MNARERFLATATFQPVDRTFLLEPWLWGQTWERWQREGLAKDTNLIAHFQTDYEGCAPVHMQGPYGPHLWPALERKILSEDETCQIVRDEEGNVIKLFTNDPTRSMPEWIEYPMTSRQDWEEIIKPRLDAGVTGRCPQGEAISNYAGKVRDRDYPLGFWSGSFYGWPRSLMGVERISVMFYDDPDLIREMCEHIADFVIAAIEPLLKQVEFDFAFVWEDMAGKAGPLCSPRIYREFMLPPLTRLTDVLHRHGVHHIIVDSDGNNDVLIPLWLEAGVTGLRPFEIAAGCDPVAIRRQYGKSFIIQGGIDKRMLAKGRQEIEREVLSKVPWLCLQGGYFPQVDHLVPPDVSLENYTYYSRLLRAVVEDPERWLAEAKQKAYWCDN
jgi:hypothetical protein